MNSKEKLLALGISCGLALILVLLFFGQLGSRSWRVTPIATVTASPVLQAVSDDNCETPCLAKDKKPMPTVQRDLKFEQSNVPKDDSSFRTNSVAQAITVTNESVPPVAHQLVISDGIPTTAEVIITLDVTAIDPDTPGASGMQSIEFIEFEYILGARRWVPIQRSGWVDYSIAHEGYPWTLASTYGIRYMQAWAMDLAGNISDEPTIDVINLVPSEQAASVSEGEVDFYRILINAGETLSATLTSVSGDADLYIWAPNNESPWYSNYATEVERLQLVMMERGTYNIEVHGYTNAEYRLSFEATTEPPTEAFRTSQGNSDKLLPSKPKIRLGDIPSDSFNLDP
jgi:hypothetical protein